MEKTVLKTEKIAIWNSTETSERDWIAFRKAGEDPRLECWIGEDGKYCYISHSHEVTLVDGKDTETISPLMAILTYYFGYCWEPVKAFNPTYRKKYKKPKCFCDIDYRLDTRPCGGSDIATLIVAGPPEFCFREENIHTKFLVLHEVNMHEDGNYRVHIVNAPKEWTPQIHYGLECVTNHWCKIYDDERKVLEVEGNLVRVYRAGKTMLVHIIH